MTSKNFKYLLLTKSVGMVLNFLSVTMPKKAAQIGYRLHSEPRIGKLNAANLPKILQESVRDLFLVDDVPCQSYTWKGNSEIILLVHGWESNSARWEQLLPFLIATGKTVVAIDAPAHGLSGGKSFSVPKYAKIIDVACQLINPNYLIGHSIGGAACMFYQYHYQNMSLKKMILLGAPSDLDVLINNFCLLLSLNRRLKKHLTTEFEKQLDFSVVNFTAINFGAKINTPAMVVHDRSDSIVSFDESQKIIKHWKYMTFIETEKLGHSLHDNQLYQKIANYINDLNEVKNL